MTTARSMPNRPRAILSRAVLAASVLAVVAGCSSTSAGGGGASASTSTPPSSSASQGGGASSGATSAITVHVKNFSFEPATLTVAVGTKVTWNFDDDTAHTVKADDKSFSSSALKHGQSFSFTFNKAGTYQYICSIHQYMTGTVVVK